LLLIPVLASYWLESGSAAGFCARAIEHGKIVAGFSRVRAEVASGL
jgi:hypothetical protein